MDPWEVTSEQRKKQFIERSYTFRQILSMQGSLNQRIFTLCRASNVKFDIDNAIDNRFLQIKQIQFKRQGKRMILLTI